MKPADARRTWRARSVIGYANQQFALTEGPPAQPMQVQIRQHDYGTDGKSKALIGKCKDGGTCNKLAAMYKALVPTSRPRVVCSKTGVPGIGASGRTVTGFTAFSQLKVEARKKLKKDVSSQCARLGACKRKIDAAETRDVYIECRRAPSKFKRDCASKPVCKEVAACMGG